MLSLFEKESLSKINCIVAIFERFRLQPVSFILHSSCKKKKLSVSNAVLWILEYAQVSFLIAFCCPAAQI